MKSYQPTDWVQDALDDALWQHYMGDEEGARYKLVRLVVLLDNRKGRYEQSQPSKKETEADEKDEYLIR